MLRGIQLSLLPVTESIVNVASVPKRSPFRYPGGKTWLVPRVREWLCFLKTRPVQFFEPFAGGGIVSLTVAFEQLAGHVTMVELDSQVAAVWQTILSENANWLAKRIVQFDLTRHSVEAELTKTELTLRERAFVTILKNRTFHGGILAEGSGMIKYGEDGKGLGSRWYPTTLRKRILDISELRDRFTFIEGDGVEILRQNSHRSDAVFFIDPPYTAGGKRAGRRLYSHFELDHDELFRIASNLAGDFLMTYDDADELHELAAKYEFDTAIIAMKNTHPCQNERAPDRSLSGLGKTGQADGVMVDQDLCVPPSVRARHSPVRAPAQLEPPPAVQPKQ